MGGNVVFMEPSYKFFQEWSLHRYIYRRWEKKKDVCRYNFKKKKKKKTEAGHEKRKKEMPTCDYIVYVSAF